MFESYLRARRIIALAAVAVLLASGIIVTAFYRHITEPCRGVLEEVPLSKLPPAEIRVDVPGGDGVYLDFDRVPSKESLAASDPRGFKNVRTMWLPNAGCACKGELSLHWDPEHNPAHHNMPTSLAIYRRPDQPNLYVVHEVSGPDVFAFRRVEATGHVFVWRKALEASNVSMLILFGAMGSLLGATLLLMRAGSYALTMRDWRSARRRDDGLLEDDNGGTIARIGRVFFREANVLVNPKCIEGRAVYREVPILSRRDFAPGTHERWTVGTHRRLRDARVLAALATVTTALSVGAHFYA